MVESECQPAKHVFLAMPVYDARVGLLTMRGLLEAAPLITSAGIGLEFGFVAGNCYIEQARNQLTRNFLESQATDMIFVDSDIGFPPRALLDLALAPKCVVGGVYPKKNPQPSWPVKFKSGTVQSEPNGLVEAAFIPSGFMRINRSVFDAMAPTRRKFKSEDGSLTTEFWRCEVRDEKYWGEDWLFCADWLDLGGRIFIIPEIDFTHSGNYNWKGNWGEWTKAQMALKAAE